MGDFTKMVPIISKIVSYASNTDNRIAIIAEDQEISYKKLTQKIYSAASKLIEMGVSRGERVILAASNTPSFIYGYFATHLIGAVAVPIDPQTPVRRIEYIIKKVSPRVIFTARRIKNISKTIHSIEELNGDGSLKKNISYVLKLTDTADILFTTGTTGEPKGVVLTHQNITTAASNINQFIRNNSKDREVVSLPLSHSFGLGRLRCILLAGGTIILTKGFTFPGKIFQAIEKWKATGLSFVPAGFVVLYGLAGESIGKYNEQLRYIEIGSAPMPMEHKKILMQLLPKTRICMHYGLTEASRSTFMEFHETINKLHSIGKVSPNVEIKIGDEYNNELPMNQKGRIFVKGGMVMKEYYENEILTQESLAEGWFYTGDLGHKDEEGYIYLDGREKEIINVGGLKVSPLEVENILNQHDIVDDCACIGIPDPKGITGETVKAFLVSKGNPLSLSPSCDLQTFLKDKLEPYKIPTEYEWIKSIPKTSSGKIQRNLLKNMSYRTE